jgi:hypothetical protein
MSDQPKRIDNREELNSAVSKAQQAITQTFQDVETQAKDDLQQAEAVQNHDSIQRRQEQLNNVQTQMSQAQSMSNNSSDTL